MIIIEGKIYNTIDGTKSYLWRDENIAEHIVERNDPKFIKTDDKFKKAGVYMLIGYPKTNSNLQVYVGQTTNIRRRFNEHVKKKAFWQYFVFFQPIEEEFTSDDVSYLEHILVKELIEYGNVQILENCQIPTLPYLRIDDIDRLREILENIKLLLHYSGFPFFKYRNMNYVTEDTPPTKKHNIISRIAKEYHTMSNKSYCVSEPDADYGYIDEEETQTTYILRGYDYSADAILLKDGQYMIMPFGRVRPRSERDFEALDKKYQDAIDKVSTNIIKDMMVNDLETFCRIVTNTDDVSLVKEDVKFI